MPEADGDQPKTARSAVDKTGIKYGCGGLPPRLRCHCDAHASVETRRSAPSPGTHGSGRRAMLMPLDTVQRADSRSYGHRLCYVR